MYAASDIENIDSSRCGLKGSPTQVERIFLPEAGGEREMFDDETMTDKLFDILSAGKYL